MANQNEGSSDDTRRTARVLSAPAMPRSARDYDHITGSVHGDGDGAMIVFTIGMRGSLTKHAARAAARAWHEAIAMYPKSSICLEVAGYDSDPRELWRISEASRHVRRWARYANLTDIFDAARTPLDPASLSVLAKCGAFEDVDPETVPMVEPTIGATH